MKSRTSLALTLLLMLAGCGLSGQQDQVRVVVIDDGNRGINAVGVNLTYAAAEMRASVAQGLVGFDGQGRVVPMLAARWIVTDDGLSYIFRLREGEWSDGREITAERVAKVLTERLAELKNSRLGYDLQDVSAVIAMTGSVIEVDLKAPMPNFLQLFAQPELGLFRDGYGAGPLYAESGKKQRYISLTPLQRLRPDEQSDDTAEEDPRRLYLRSDSAASAIARFDRGSSDVLLGGRFQHLPLADAAKLDSVRFDPVSGLFGLRFIAAKGFWEAARNRELFNMAIDRPAFLASFDIVSAWVAREKIVPEALDFEGIVTKPDWATMTMDQRREFAATNIANWKRANGEIAPLRIALPNGPGADILFLRLRYDAQRVGLNIVRVDASEGADAVLIDEIAPYDSARWFVSRLSCKVTPVCNSEADEKVAAANDAMDLTEKARGYAEAEYMQIRHSGFIPIAVPLRWSATRQGVRGFTENLRSWHPLHSLIGVGEY
ncbi:MAG: ABC transporter substrate-binding protein [Parasphingorhabdus sp.]|nr:ABC transporter substrate-binding protein [Parasphingorhabdus sp.]